MMARMCEPRLGILIQGRIRNRGLSTMRGRFFSRSCGVQHRPGRAKPGKLRFQRLDPIPRRLRALAQPGVLPGQRFDRGLLAPRSPQRPAQFGIRNGQRLRQRLPDRSKSGKLGLKRLSDCTKFGRLNLQRRLPPLQLPHGPAQPGVLLAERRDRGLLAPRSPQGCTKLSSLVGRQLRQRRPGRAKLGKPSAPDRWSPSCTIIRPVFPSFRRKTTSTSLTSFRARLTGMDRAPAC